MAVPMSTNSVAPGNQGTLIRRVAAVEAARDLNGHAVGCRKHRPRRHPANRAQLLMRRRYGKAVSAQPQTAAFDHPQRIDRTENGSGRGFVTVVRYHGSLRGRDSVVTLVRDRGSKVVRDAVRSKASHRVRIQPLEEGRGERFEPNRPNSRSGPCHEHSSYVSSSSRFQ